MRCFTGSFVRNSFCVALSIGLSMLVGCTDSTQSFGKLVPVKGTVTYNGKPVPAGCVITFIHSERSFPASADCRRRHLHALVQWKA